MWTSTLDLDPKRILLTRLLGQLWPGAYFASFAPLRVQNVPRESLAASNWVRVRNRLAGICGSDLHLVYANGDLRVAPAALPGHLHSYLGHEVVGEVIELGDDVQHLRIGDRVALQYSPNCLSTRAYPLCHFCASGHYNRCERGELPAPLPIGGGWSEEMLLPEQQLFRVPESLSDEQAVMLEPAAVAVHAVLRHLPQPGEHVLVVGAGTIGLLTIAVLRALAPQTKVSVVARHPFQIEQAARLGVEQKHILYPQDGYQSVQQITQSEFYRGWLGNQMLLGGFDAIYDTVGRQKTLHDALRWARGGAAVVLVGVDLHMMHIDLTPVWHQEINLLGSLGHGIENWPPNATNQRSTFSITADLIASDQIRPEQLITHRFALTDYQHALTTAVGKSQNRSIKVLFDYALLPASVVPNVRASARPRRPVPFNSPLPPAKAEPPSEELQQAAANLPATPMLQQSSWVDPFDVMMEEDTAPVPVVKKTIDLPTQKDAEPENPLEQSRSGPEPITVPNLNAIPAAPVAPVPAVSEIETLTEAIPTQDRATASTDITASDMPATQAEIEALPIQDDIEASTDRVVSEVPLTQEEIEVSTDTVANDAPLSQDEIAASTAIISSEVPLTQEAVKAPTDVLSSEASSPQEADTTPTNNIETNEFEYEISEEVLPMPDQKQEVSSTTESAIGEGGEVSPQAPPDMSTPTEEAATSTNEATIPIEEETTSTNEATIPTEEETTLTKEEAASIKEQVTSTNKRARPTTRRKRATNDTSGALLQEEVSQERKRSRPRGRKKTEE